MKKYIVAIAALFALAVPTAAMAASSDANGVVTVTKGDIQSAMGWNNAQWETAIGAPNGVANVGNLITASHGNTPVDVPGGWLTLNGQIVANYPSDEYFSSSFTNPENWGPNSTPVSSYWEGGIDTTVSPILNAQKKVTGYRVTAAPTPDGYVYWTRHTTYSNPDYAGATYVYHATSRWPVSVAGGSGVTDVQVGGKPVTVTAAV